MRGIVKVSRSIRRLSVVAVVLFALLPLVAASCSSTGFTGTKFNITAYGNSIRTDSLLPNTSLSLSASCQSGEQMVGGDYLVQNDSGNDSLLVVEGSYPSALNTWTVIFRNPDNPPYYNDEGKAVVLVDVYCVTTPNFPLNIEIATTNSSIGNALATPTDVSVRCSKRDTIALTGGFMTTSLRPYTEPGGAVHETYWPGLYGTGIETIGPVFPDAQHSSMGWRVVQAYTPALFATAPQVGMSTTAYALCAQTGLTGESYHMAVVRFPAGGSGGTRVTCDKDEFVVGGGYQQVSLPNPPAGVPLVMASRVVTTSASFSTWEVLGANVGSNASALALCVHIPQI